MAGQAQETDKYYLSITELTRLFNETLETAFPEVHFSGEISQITRAASGHIYFTVKDSESQVSAVMWRGLAQGLTFEPEQGVSVLCHGRPNIYHKSGRFQVVVNKMVAAGEGALQQAFLKLKARLEKEGYFSEDRKRPIPIFPKSVGIVTSGTGAAIHDMLVKIRERMPSTKVTLVDVRVQGPGSAEEIAKGIDLLNEQSDVETIIIGRGGGSLEDLWAFNEEVVVKSVFRSRIPVISGVGHEVDISLSDLAADVRAPTPTAAAEMLVPHRDELLTRINEYSRRLADTDRWFQAIVQEFDDLVEAYEEAVFGVLEDAKDRLSQLDALLRALEPSKLIARFTERVRFFAAKLSSALPVERIHGELATLKSQQAKLKVGLNNSLAKQKLILVGLESRLFASSPPEVLKRGYAIVRSGGDILKSPANVKLGDEIEVNFAAGALDTQVKAKKNKNFLEEN